MSRKPRHRLCCRVTEVFAVVGGGRLRIVVGEGEHGVRCGALRGLSQHS